MEKYYVGDFETSSIIKFKKGFLDKELSEAYVWLWCIMDCSNTAEYKIGNDIESFFDYISTIGEKKDKIHINFHNLKFDGSYIMDYIFRNTKLIENKLSNKFMKEGQFKTLIDGMGKWYSITIKLNGRFIILEDSLKKLPFSVAQLGKMLDLEETKGEINYTAERQKGYLATEEEIDYVRRDCKVVCNALQSVLFDNNYFGLTIGSNCFKEYKDSLRNYNLLFPELTDAVDRFCRNSYIGGLCQKNTTEHYVGKITIIDKNSMYPSMMHSTSGNIYPSGTPKYFVGEYKNDKIFPLYMQHFKCDLELKEDRFGFLQTKGFQLGSVFFENEKGIELTLNNIDMENLFECYNISNIEYIDGYKFMACFKKFDSYIDKWYCVKEEATKTGNKAMRLLAKLFLNNLYGKFGSAPGGELTALVYEDEEIHNTREASNRKSTYVPVASFCTAYARKDLLTNINMFGKENVLYMDTDSIHVKDINVADYAINLDKNKLNCWAVEGIATEGIYIRQKTYAEKINDSWDIKACGCPDRCKKNINVKEDFKVGLELEGKLSPMKIKGGVILVESTFTIK